MPRVEILTERNQRIRDLDAAGWSLSEIAKHLEIAHGQVWAVVFAEKHREQQRLRQRRYQQRKREARRGTT